MWVFHLATEKQNYKQMNIKEFNENLKYKGLANDFSNFSL